jgi:hypothetical protein
MASYLTPEVEVLKAELASARSPRSPKGKDPRMSKILRKECLFEPSSIGIANIPGVICRVFLPKR